MSKLILDISMSLDGFITGPNPSHDNPFGEGGERLHAWMGNNPPASLKQGGGSDTKGAVLVGRNTYDQIDGWGGSHPGGIGPVFVVSKDIPENVPNGNSTYTFVTDGIASAVAQAKEAAGDKDVYLAGGGSIASQCINANLMDEMKLHVVHIFLSDGVRLFQNLKQQELNQTSLSEENGVTHLTFSLSKG